MGFGLPVSPSEEGNGPQRVTYVFPWMSAAQVTLWRIPEVVERMFSGLDPASTLHLVQANLDEQGDPPEESLFEGLEASYGRLKRRVCTSEERGCEVPCRDPEPGQVEGAEQIHLGVTRSD